MKTIHKYPFKVEDITLDIGIPDDAVALTVQMQSGRPCLWVELDTDKPKKGNRFMVFGTGQGIPDHAQYVATWQEPPDVWHLYWVGYVNSYETSS